MGFSLLTLVSDMLRLDRAAGMQRRLGRVRMPELFFFQTMIPIRFST